MSNLVSGEYSLKAFCTAMHGKDPWEVMDAACVEIGSARRLHREATKCSDFRKGSKGREYCDSLQMLISMIMNGTVPDGASSSFLTTVKPLFVHLLQKWQIGTLRQAFAQVPSAAASFIRDTADPLVVVVSKAEVDAMDTSHALSTLRLAMESPGSARALVERFDIAFHGYDHTTEELFEIPEVRNFVDQLDQQFPFWLFFLSKRHLGLKCLLFCLLPPFLTEEARLRNFPERINQLLSNRWLPAMSHVCQYAGFSESEIERLAERAVRYIEVGRFPLDAEPFA